WLPAPVEEVRPADHRPSIAETPPSITETIPPDEQVAPSPPNSQQAVANESIAFASTEAQAPGPLRPHLSWTAWLMLVWAMAVVAQFAMLLGHLARLRYLLKHASPAGSALESLVRDCAARVKLTRIPRVLTVDKDCSPFVSGIWRTVIVLPRCMEALLADGLLEPVIVHELAHVTRLDLLWNWIPQLARIFYFFNPVVYWVAFRVRLEGELACDGWAMAATGKAAGDYADLLVRVVSQLSEPAILRSGSAASAGFDGQGNVNRNE
ncbi:MAG TPA: M56 family metallopeptidase, partial [Pirellulales bacterium]|nr:M56 family metallopeptidase [Pirellulales bacterium]